MQSTPFSLFAPFGHHIPHIHRACIACLKKDEDGYTPLHRASYNGRLRAIGYLLSQNADVSARTEDGWTALHCAARWAKPKAVTLLLENGADINATTKGYMFVSWILHDLSCAGLLGLKIE